jgi:D-alanine--poly(phosphoribitol) ligase subunit 1
MHQLIERAGSTATTLSKLREPRTAGVVEPWSTPLLSHLPAADRLLFQRFGQGPVEAAPYSCIHHAFEHHAETQPYAVAAEHLGETITYGELNRQANRLAARLARHGVRPGDNVALFVRRSIPMLVGLLATLKAGAAYVPQDVGWPRRPNSATSSRWRRRG